MPEDFILCDFRIAIDTREQAPWSFTGFRADAAQGRKPLIIQTVTTTLASGDYSIDGLEAEVSIERKSVADFYGTILAERERFERELTRLQAMCDAGGHAEIVCEGDWFTEGPPLLRGEQSDVACIDCGGLGSLDSGGQNPWGGFIDVPCGRCNGTGVIVGMSDEQKRKRAAKRKVVFRSVIAWRQRFPLVHWERMPSRREAEQYAFRVLERFWNERVKRLKAQ